MKTSQAPQPEPREGFQRKVKITAPHSDAETLRAFAAGLRLQDDVLMTIMWRNTLNAIADRMECSGAHAQFAAEVSDKVRTYYIDPRGERKHSHYHKDVRHLDSIDVYRVLSLFNVTDPCLQHAVKKLLVAGGRGAGKDVTRDVQEAIDSLTRWQEMHAEDGRAA